MVMVKVQERVEILMEGLFIFEELKKHRERFFFINYNTETNRQNSVLCCAAVSSRSVLVYLYILKKEVGFKATVFGSFLL